MNEIEKQEIEAIRLELIDMFQNSSMFPSINFRIISRLCALSHRIDTMPPNNAMHSYRQRPCECPVHGFTVTHVPECGYYE